MDSLKELVIELLTKRLEELTLIPEVSVRDSYSVSEVHRQITTKEKYDEEQTHLKDDTKYEEMQLDFEVQEEKKEIEIKEKQELEENIPFEIEEVEPEKKTRIKKMIPRGVVLMTYIVAENEDGMYLIDQHAAAERINYEKILKQLNEEPIIIDLLIPIKIELRPDEFILAKDRFDLLEKYGFNVSEFGFNTIIIRSHPAWISEDKAEDVIRKVVDIIIEKE